MVVLHDFSVKDEEPKEQKREQVDVNKLEQQKVLVLFKKRY